MVVHEENGKFWRKMWVEKKNRSKFFDVTVDKWLPRLYNRIYQEILM